MTALETATKEWAAEAAKVEEETVKAEAEATALVAPA